MMARAGSQDSNILVTTLLGFLFGDARSHRMAKVFLLMLLCFPAAAQAITAWVSSPATDSDGTFVVTWKVDPGTRSPSGYANLYERANGGSWVFVVNSTLATQHSRTISKSAAGTYEYYVQYGYYGQQVGRGSPPWIQGSTSITTIVVSFPPPPPATPSTFTVPSSDSDGNYSVSWSGVSTATYYTLQEKVGSGTWTTIQNTSATSKLLSGKGNNTYSYRVRACNSSGCSAYSVVKSTVVLLPPSTAPSTFTVPSLDNDGSYSISWSSVSTATYYTLQEKVGSGTWTTIQNTSATSRLLSGKSNNTYSYQVRACNSGGCSAYSPTKSIIVSPLSVPDEMNAEYSSAPHGLRISWGGVVNATSYKVARSVDGGVSWINSYYSGAATQFIDTDIDNHPGAIYYRVQACNTVCSNWTDTPAAK